jgi:Tfp pilus assembly protein PilP
MKLTIKRTTGILAMAITMVVGGSAAAQAQSPDAIDNARSTAKSLQQTQANGSSPAPAAAKPAPGAPAPAVKPAAIPGAKSAPAAKPAAAHTSANNQLQKVNVLPGPDGVDIEITSSQTVTPRVSKLKSPDRLVVELPETVLGSAQNKIPVGSGGVKGVRIGMDGKTPPTTSVVVDLEKAMAYDMTPGDAGQLILTLHAQGAAPAAPVVAKTAPAPAKPAPAKTAAPAAQPKTVAAKAAAPAAAQPQPAAAKPAATKAAVIVAKADPMKPPAKLAAKETKPAAPAPAPEPKVEAKTEAKIDTKTEAKPEAASAAKEPKPEDKKWAMSGKRDPFFSPVVQQNGSGCSTGKKCLEIGTINLRGVVKSDSGFIAVVTNNMNKAYFLRENDPVFNGYVVKITGDSVVFQETVLDKLGKSFTREVVKRIFTPAV